MDIYTLVVFLMVILLIIYLVVVAFYSNRVSNFSIPTTGESNLLFWVTILFIVLIVILLIYTIVRFFVPSGTVTKIIEKITPAPSVVKDVTVTTTTSKAPTVVKDVTVTTTTSPALAGMPPVMF
jgi:hypothetical protein